MEWLRIQLTHDVSIAATDAFWSLAIQWIGRLHRIRDIQGIKRKIPQFPNQRKKMYEKECPKVSMSFTYMNNETDEIIHVNNVENTPLKNYDRNNAFTKLYESAFIKVF